MSLDPQNVLKGIHIPPRPGVLIDLMEEQRKDDPDLKKMTSLISKDVGMSAALLKAVNSPFFGLRKKAASVPDAMHFLGMKNVMNLVSGFSLKKAIGNAPLSVEKFWNMSESVALISAFLASRLPGVPKDEAYTFGLFHNCGMPLIEQKFPQYESILAKADRLSQKPLTEYESEQLHTDHASVGFLLTRSWHLTESICEATRRHHDPSVFEGEASPKVSTLVAIAMLANNVHRTLHKLPEEGGSGKCIPCALAHLGLSQLEFEDLRDSAQQMLGKVD
ncbi:MAG: HDOD domain-containing protein [Burkholderiales bacterium]|nr:HDOD domain-containing protein [Burkholderiales bacterium]